MKKSLSIFRLALLAIFFIFFVIGFILFATFQAENQEEKIRADIKIYGTFDENIINALIKNLNFRNLNFSNLSYTQFDHNEYEMGILRSIAAGDPPDLILISNENLFNYSNKIKKIPIEVYSIRTFVDTFVDAFSIFYSDNGIFALPFIIDPMVMYYNKDIFNNYAIATPPKYWSEFKELSRKITNIGEKKNINRATIAFGEVVNVKNFDSILATLFLQTGNRISYLKDRRYVADDSNLHDIKNAIHFFLSFSNPRNTFYSWNKSLPNSRDVFLSGKLATYFGFSSELRGLRLKNPNLNFDIAMVPNPKKKEKKQVFARVWGLAIPKSSKNPSTALEVARVLSGKEAQEILSKKINLPPVRRDLLSQRSGDKYMDILYKKAIFGSTFVNPDKRQTREIFKFMINSIKGGQSANSIIKRSFQEIDALFR